MVVWNISTSSGLSAGADGWGRRDKPSQMACCLVPRNSNLYEKAPRKRHQHRILAAALTGTAFPGFIMYSTSKADGR